MDQRLVLKIISSLLKIPKRKLKKNIVIKIVSLFFDSVKQALKQNYAKALEKRMQK